ncbi:MAG: serine/threonine-protein kinase [Acidobacteriota bacterium]
MLDATGHSAPFAPRYEEATGLQSLDGYPGEGNQADPFIGRVIEGRYRVDAKLGKGGMGVVYRATRLQIDDAVAIKILRAELLADPQSLERFRREAKAAARLKHPNVVTIHDFGITHDHIAYLVMELVDGENLRELIDRQGSLSQADAVEITCQICAALDEAHRLGIVHRDLKPDNIVLGRFTGALRVKVLDFGIAKLRDLTLGSGSLTESGMVLGTPRYMSPEQCLGEEIDGRSDIYSLGIVLYEMLAGAAPFNSPSFGALIMQHVNHTPQPLRAIKTTIAPAIEVVVAGALEKRREARPQSAIAFSTQLKAALSGENAVSTIWRNSFNQQSAGPVAAAPDLSGHIEAQAAMGSGLPRTSPLQSLDSGAVIKRNTPSRLLVTVVALFVLALAVTGWGLWMSTNRRTEGDNPGMTTGDSAPRQGPSGRGNGLPAESIAKSLAKAETDFRMQQYDAVIAACNSILVSSPDQPLAELLLGESYYNKGSAKGTEYLAKAIDMGETVTLPIKHHHYEGALKIDEGFCSGYVKLRKATFEFHSEETTAHDFSAPTDKIYDLRDDSYKGGRLHLKVGVLTGMTEVAQNYNFYAPPAGLRKQMTITRVYCENPACQPMAQTLYQLLARFKK